MIQQNYSDIIETISKSANISKEEVEIRVNKKLSELQDLVSKEGAAHIVANDLKVKLFDNIQRNLKIENILPGMNSVTVTGRVINVYGVKEFKTATRAGKLMSLMLGDETGTMRVVIWDENLIKSLITLKETDIIKIKNAYSKQNNMGYKELHIGNKAQIILNPEGEEIGNIKIKLNPIRKQVKDLEENELAEIVGTVVQVFEPKSYQACPSCNKKVSQQESTFFCEQHGTVMPKLNPILNIFLDDSTGVIRTVLFRDNAEKLIKENINNFDALRSDLGGKQLLLQGKVIKNMMFDRLEFIANSVEEADPEKLLKELQNDV